MYMCVCGMCSGAFSGFLTGLHACPFIPLHIAVDTVTRVKWISQHSQSPLPCSILFRNIYHCLAKLSNLLIMFIICVYFPSPPPPKEFELHQERDFYLFCLLK